MTITREIYDRLHSACPKCGSHTIESELVSFRIDDLSSQDRNKVACCSRKEDGTPDLGCGWEGITHDLVPSVEDAPLLKLLEAIERARLLATGDVNALSPAGRAAIVLADELTGLTVLLMGYINGTHTSTEPIINYLLYRGLLVKDENGVKLM